MPVYNVACPRPLPEATRAAVAGAITQTHCRETDAPAAFVNVVLMHNYPLPAGVALSVLGGVRSGGNRTPESIEALRQALIIAVAQAAGVEAQAVAVELLGAPAQWAMEGGRVLPEPGAEEAWFAAQR